MDQQHFLRMNVKQLLTIFTLMGILCLAGILRLVCFAGFDNSDTATYSHIAYQMTQGVWQLGKNYGGPAVSPLRLGVVGPVALFYQFFSVSEMTLLILPFTLSLGNILLAFVGGMALQGRLTGLIAAAFCAIIPVEVHTATILLPDLPQSFGINACFIALVCAAKCKTRKCSLPLSIFAGLMLLYGWYSKEMAVYALPAVIAVCLVMIYLNKTRIPLVGAFIATVIIGFVAESVLYFYITGDLLFRLHEISRFTIHGSGVQGLFVENATYGTGYLPGQYWSALMRRLFQSGPEAIFGNSNFGLAPLFGGIALSLLIRRRTTSTLLIAIWFVTIIATFNFGTMSLRFWQPLVIDKGHDRYLQPIVLPAVILSAWLVTSWNFLPRQTRIISYFVRLTVAIVIVASCVPVLMKFQLRRGLGALESRVLHNFIRPDEVLYTDDRTKWGFLFFWGYPEKTNTWEISDLVARDVPPDSYVLINEPNLENLAKRYQVQKPDFLQHPPQWWKQMWRSSGRTLYYVPEVDSSLHPDAYIPIETKMLGTVLSKDGNKSETSGSLRITGYGNYTGSVFIPQHATTVTLSFSSVIPNNSLPFLSIYLTNFTGRYRAHVLHSYSNVPQRDTISFPTDLGKGSYIFRLEFFNAGYPPRTQEFVLDYISFQ